MAETNISSPPADVPRHVAIIMDGNGRWAKQRNRKRHAGHRAGVRSVRAAVETAAKRGVDFLTLFAFSSENWSRPAEEVSSLMGLFVEALRREVDELHRNNVRLNFVGALDRLNAGLHRKIRAAEARTRNNTGLQLNVAIAYGGRWDILSATRQLLAKVSDGSLGIDDIDETAFANALQLGGMPDPDLLIRTGGEQRISNFLLWNLAYAELYFCQELWPDFGADEFDAALAFYAGKQRRFGHTGDQVEAVGC